MIIDEDTNVTNNQSSQQSVNDISNNDDSSSVSHPWNLLDCKDWDNKKPSSGCLLRIKRDISSILKDPPPGIFIDPETDDITKIHALIVGPLNTPYQGGFFYFILRFPPDYPIRPPRCLLMTTGKNTVSCHPSLCRNGKIFLSIINTWDEPSWSPSQSISSLLLSIQSLLSNSPCHNEPGFEKEHRPGDADSYHEIVSHETLRVAVCEMLENPKSCPEKFREIMIKQFFKYYYYYIVVCTDNMDKDNQLMEDPFGERRGSFQYSSLFTRLQQLKGELEMIEISGKQQQSTDPNSPSTPETFDKSVVVKLPDSQMDLEDTFDDIETYESETENDEFDNYGDNDN